MFQKKRVARLRTRQDSDWNEECRVCEGEGQAHATPSKAKPLIELVVRPPRLLNVNKMAWLVQWFGRPGVVAAPFRLATGGGSVAFVGTWLSPASRLRLVSSLK